MVLLPKLSHWAVASASIRCSAMASILSKIKRPESLNLKVDQHELVALMAPRPVLLSNATGDKWANPGQQFEVLKAAEPVYKQIGRAHV